MPNSVNGRPKRERVDLEFKAVVTAPIEVSETDRVVKALYAICGNVDSYGDIILPGAFVKTIADRLPSGNIKVLWQHDMSCPPIATPLVLKELGVNELPMALRQATPEATGALYGEVQYLDTPRANEVLAGIRGGAITQNSIGFDVMKMHLQDDNGDLVDMSALSNDPWLMYQPGYHRVIEELRLWDVSPVVFGANDSTMNVNQRQFKAAIPYRKTPVDRDGAWDGPAMLARIEAEGADLEAAMRALCAWVDPETDPQTKSAYSYPHHDVDTDGSVGDANYRACIAVIASLNGGRGGANIPDSDRQGVYNHVAKHIRDAGEEPPELKNLNGPEGVFATIWTFADFWERNATELKAGRVLSDTNYQKLKTAHEHISAVLQSAESSTSEDVKTLTDDIEAMLRAVELEAFELSLIGANG